MDPLADFCEVHKMAEDNIWPATLRIISKFRDEHLNLAVMLGRSVSAATCGQVRCSPTGIPVSEEGDSRPVSHWCFKKTGKKLMAMHCLPNGNWEDMEHVEIWAPQCSAFKLERVARVLSSGLIAATAAAKYT
eukprot:9466700-Pyramimonas_sp.AAC.1